MPSITNLPKELVLEITRLSSLKDAINLLRTCKTLYDIIDVRSFWTDQLRSLYWLFQPLLPLQLNSLPVPELRKMATKPYGFERAVLKRKLRTVSPLHLKPDLFGEFEDVKIVSGGQWLVTLSVEWDRNPESDSPAQPFVRLWRISPPVRKNFDCITAMKLPVDFAPLELCLQPGDAPLDLLVFVNTFSTTDPENGSYLHVLQINLAAKEPEISFLAELKTDRFCSGMSLQCGNLVATFYVPGAEHVKAFMWNWRNGEKLEALSRERGGTSWFLVVSEILHVIWNADSRFIGVHWSPKSDRPGREDRHFPVLSDTLPNPPQGVQAILPVLNECRRSSGDPLQVALTHLEEETLRVDIENLGVGGVSFTRYPKDNTYMQDPKDPSDPFGNEFEAPSDFIQTVGGHLVDMSSSGRVTVYFSTDTKEHTKLGESISYLAFTDFNGRTSENHIPFMCPFSGVVGSVSQSGNFYIWRTK